MEIELTRIQRLRLVIFGRVYLVRRIKDWLNGTFTCINCNQTFHLYTFGYGKAICPDCYKGENPWFFPQDPIMMRLFNHG